MEFKFRAVDDRPPPPPIVSSFSEPPLPLPLPLPSTTPGHSFTPMTPFSDALPGFPSDGSDFRPYPSPMRNLEKEWIREEIITAEIARRRELEAEVRQEIMFLEREMAMRRAARTGGFALGDSFAPMRCNTRPPLPLSAHPFDDRLVPIRWSASPRPLLGHSSISEPVVLPLAPPPEDVTAELKASTEPNKDKLIVLAKPDPNLCGTKRKAVEPPTLDPNELHPFGLKKKPKEEWSCALCQVSATSEKALNGHLRGKKHMAKEAKLNSQSAGAQVPKKTGSGSANPELKAKVEAQTSEQNVAASVSNKKKNRKRDLKLKNILPTTNRNAGGLKISAGSETVMQADGAVKQKKVKKFKFWCEICRIGSYASQVMEDHMKGKKHSASLLVHKYKNGDGAASKTIHISSEAIVPKPEATDVVTAIIPKPEALDAAYELNKSDEASSKSICIPNPNVVYDFNKTDEAASGVISLKGAIIPKLEDPNVGFEPNESNEASAKSICFSSDAIIPKWEDRDVYNQANKETAVGNVKNLDNASSLPEANIVFLD